MLENISQLKQVEVQWLDQIVSELSLADVNLESLWREPYPEYGSAGLKVATLLNPTGEQENFDYSDCHSPVVTPLLEKLPSLLAFFKESGLEVMGARLLRLDPGTFLHEHRDFVYLEKVPRYRLHLPLITNDNAFITSPGINIHFQRGYLWKLDPKQTVHSACNFGATPRIHLMLDCYVNKTLTTLVQGQFFDEKLKHQLPLLSVETKAKLLQESRELLEQSLYGQPHLVTKAEEVLLKTFCLYDLAKSDLAKSDLAKNNLTSYDLLFELFQSPAFAARKTYWQERCFEVYSNNPKVAVALSR